MVFFRVLQECLAIGDIGGNETGQKGRVRRFVKVEVKPCFYGALFIVWLSKTRDGYEERFLRE